MKKIKKGLKRLITNYMLNSNNYVPIYSGDKLLGFSRKEDL